jgi:alpha-beta hydrolase superfamily lysophospholipase
MSIADNAKKLDDYVGCIEKFHPDDKLDIVAHSMGGLVARRYILDFSADSKVDKVITMGTPWVGAAGALYALEWGGLDMGFIDEVVQVRNVMQPLATYFKGMHEILPTQKYFELGGTPFKEDGWDINGNRNPKETYKYLQYLHLLDTRMTDTQPGAVNSLPGTAIAYSTIGPYSATGPLIEAMWNIST